MLMPVILATWEEAQAKCSWAHISINKTMVWLCTPVIPVIQEA
jgi:hypothetical protein